MSYLTYTDEDTGVLVYVEFDATESAAASHVATPTEHPVSDAAVALNDFLYVQSPQIKLDAWITETPLYPSMATEQGGIVVSQVAFLPSSYEATVRWTDQASPPSVRQLVPVPGAGRADNRQATFTPGRSVVREQKIVVSGQTRVGGSRTREVYEELVRLQRDAVLVDLYTKLGTYPGCWITEISAPTSAAGAIKFGLTFVKTRFGSVFQADDIGRARKTEEKRAKPQEYLGAQTGYSEFDLGDVKKSIAKRGVDAL